MFEINRAFECWEIVDHDPWPVDLDQAILT
jgi:hypothetical protein